MLTLTLGDVRTVSHDRPVHVDGIGVEFKHAANIHNDGGNFTWFYSRRAVEPVCRSLISYFFGMCDTNNVTFIVHILYPISLRSTLNLRRKCSRELFDLPSAKKQAKRHGL
jgi:hypothetical protein